MDAIQPDCFYNQSAVIPYRIKKGKIKIMLITNHKNERWIIPKGIIEPHLTPADSAAKEAKEEAGITGEVSQIRVGEYEYDKWEGTCHVQVFLLRVERVKKRWLEDFRSRKWVSVKKAAKRIHEPALKDMILQLPTLLATKMPQDCIQTE
jgi:phosphohistidine phosphatase